MLPNIMGYSCASGNVLFCVTLRYLERHRARSKSDANEGDACDARAESADLFEGEGEDEEQEV